MRYGFAVATWLSVAAFYVLVRRLYGERVAWWAAAFFALTPMVAYYGRVPGHDQLGLLVSFLFAAVLVNWLRQPNRVRLLALILLAWMAVWTAWTAVFFVAALGLTAMLWGSQSQRLAVIGLGGVVVVAFIALMLFYQAQWSESIDSILDAFVWRSSSASDDPDSAAFTLTQFVAVTVVHAGFFITGGVLVFSLIGVYVLWRQDRLAGSIVLALLLAGLGYQLIFRNASYVHDYYKLVLVPALAVAAGVAWVHGRRGRILRPLMDTLMVLVFIQSVLVFAWAHHTGNRPWMDAVIETVAAEMQPGDRIMTHLAGKDMVMPLRFYLFHAVDEDRVYTDALAAGGRVLFIECPDWDDNHEPVADDDHRIIEADTCRVHILPN